MRKNTTFALVALNVAVFAAACTKTQTQPAAGEADAPMVAADARVESPGLLGSIIGTAQGVVREVEENARQVVDVAREKAGEFRTWIQSHACEGIELASRGLASGYFIYNLLLNGGLPIEQVVTVVPGARELWDRIRGAASEEGAIEEIRVNTDTIRLLFERLLSRQCSPSADAES